MPIPHTNYLTKEAVCPLCLRQTDRNSILNQNVNQSIEKNDRDDAEEYVLLHLCAGAELKIL